MTQAQTVGPKLLVTGFGPFPGAAENPTEGLVERIAGFSPSRFGAAALKAVVLPAEYRRSWTMLRPILARFAPDVVVHFGLNRRGAAIAIERGATKRVDAVCLDAAGAAPPSGVARRSGPERVLSTLPVSAIQAALTAAGIPAEVSEDAGRYVCNATLYRSLCWNALPSRRIGFIHVPPAGDAFPAALLAQAAEVILRTSCLDAGARRPQMQALTLR